MFHLSVASKSSIILTISLTSQQRLSTPAAWAGVTGIAPADASALVETELGHDMIEFVLAFREKREDIKRSLYKADPEISPNTNGLIHGNQLVIEQALGKLLLKKILPRLQEQGFNGGIVKAASPTLVDPELQAHFVI